MPYEFLDDIATADVAFRASGRTQAEMFCAAADAVLNVMLADTAELECRIGRVIRLEAEDLEILLFQYLQELIFLKDARRLLLHVSVVDIEQGQRGYKLEAKARGDVIDPERHHLHVDIKAVTLHEFCVRQTDTGWEATVVLDI